MNEKDIQNAKKRWYDTNATYSLAVDLLAKANEKIQLYLANYIIEEAKNRGVTLSCDKKEDFNYVWKRWQDKDEKLFMAMEYFKSLEADAKKQVALEIIEIMKKLNLK